MPTPPLGEPFHLTPLCDQEVVNEKVNLGLGKLALLHASLGRGVLETKREGFERAVLAGDEASEVLKEVELWNLK